MSEPDASSSVKGITKLDVDPDVSSSPIAVGANSPVLLAIQQTKYLSSYASLSAALTAIGSSTKTSLKVTSSTAVTSDTTITDNISVILEGNGAFNISSGKVLTIENGAGFQSSSERQAFTGAGNVLFNGSLPAVVYPEWWGAVGDGSTDDIAAFNKILTAYPGAAGKYIKIALHSGKNYKCSDSWDVDNGIELNGPGLMTFAANKRGIVLHHVGTKTGTNDGRTSTNSIVRNVKLFGNNNSSTVVSTHTVSVSANTVTRTAGANFLGSDGYGEGNTININGFNYVMDSVIDTDTLEIKAPFPIVVAASTHSTTLTPGDFRGWDVSGLWDGQDIIINGETYSIDRVNGSPFEITLTSTFQEADGIYLAYIQGLGSGSGFSARPNLYHGIDLRSQCRIEDCYVYNFPGNAISGGGSNTQGSVNCNNSFIERNSTFLNAGSGFFSHGLDSNQINIHNCDHTDNYGYGIWEHGFLGNQYFGNHTAGNCAGSTDAIKDSINFSTFVGEYSEGGQPPETYGQNALKLSGTSGAGIAPDSYGGYLRVGGNRVFLDNLVVSLPVNATNSKAIMSGLGGSNQANSAFVFGAGEEDANLSAAYQETDAKYPAYQLLYGLPADGWYGLQFKTDTLSTPGTTTWTVSGSAAQEGGGVLWLRNGFGVGERTLNSVPSFRSNWKWVTSIPTSGTTLAGDIFWNSSGNPVGWITTTAGTIGSGAVLTPFGASGASKTLTATASINFGNTAAGTTSELTITVTGAAVGDAAYASPNTTVESGLSWSAYVSAADTVTIRIANVTSAAIDPASRSWRVAVIKF